MAPTRSSRMALSSQSSPSRCPVCYRNGFKSGDTDDRSDIAELQSNPQDPSFVNHAARLVSSFDLDKSSEEAAVRDAAFREEATLAVQVVVTSTLRSPIFSPAERARILAETRASIKQLYHMDKDDLDRILSEPFRTLDDLTPLEFEILRWDPIWEGPTGTGGYSTGMETIQFLVCHWKRSTRRMSGEPDEELAEDVRSQLLPLIRTSCLRRLDPTAPKYAGPNEDSTNILFQRLNRLIRTQSSGAENNPFGTVCSPVVAGNYHLSIIHELQCVESRPVSQASVQGSSSPQENHNDKDVDFTALISIPDFVTLLHSSAMIDTHSEPADAEANAAYDDNNAGLRLVQSLIKERRQHPYIRPLPRIQAQTGGRTGSSNSSSTVVPSSTTEHWIPGLSPNTLLIDFLAAHRGWTLGVGMDSLELVMLSQDKSFQSEHVQTPEVAVHAEVRIVSPPSKALPQQDEMPEYVFTFPTIRETDVFLSDKPLHQKSPTVSRISPCFADETWSEAPSNARKPVRQFGDSRLLHAGELLLELRVRTQPSPSDMQRDICVHESLAAEGVSRHSKKDNSAWSVLSAPPRSGTPSSTLSFTVSTADMASGPTSLGTVDGTASSWVQV